MFSPDRRPVQEIFSYDQLPSLLEKTYGRPAADFALRNSIELIERAYPSPQMLKGLRILDLGCGCSFDALEVNDHFIRKVWEPWSCRSIHMLGGNAVGIDIGSLSRLDAFEFHSMDLRKEDALAKFEDHSFDGVICSNLFSSPHLVYSLSESRESRALMLERLRLETQRLLKSSGKLIAFDTQLDNH